MYRRILNVAALVIVSAGTAQLLAKPAEGSTEDFCCTSRDGNATCCGSMYCSSNTDSCEARDKPAEALQ